MTTKEFSICLMSDEKTTRLINAIRETLPESPHRDDRPHMTLLRGLSSHEELSDGELADRINGVVDFSALLKFDVYVRRSMNWQGSFGWTSVIWVRAPKELQVLRKRLMRELIAKGFRVALRDRWLFLPHITIRLGVPIGKRGRKELSATLPAGSSAGFSSVVVFRTIKEDRRLLIREIPIDL